MPVAEPTPARREANAASEAAPAAEPAPAQTASAEPAGAGSARIQLAAVKSEAALAQKEWVRLQKANPDVLGPPHAACREVQQIGD